MKGQILTGADLRAWDRIVVLGTTGAGKTTLAKRISTATGHPFIELDHHKWQPRWTPVPDDEFRSRVQAAVSQERWIVDGNYGAVRDIVWPRAQAFIWLDYPFPRIFTQLLLRTLRRNLTGEPLWNGNVETLRRSFFSKDSILWWAIKSHPQKKARYPVLLAEAERSGKIVFRIPTPTHIRLDAQDKAPSS